MDVTQVSQLISSVGFPIFACIIMWKTLQESISAHKKEMDAMKESLNHNTVVLAELKTLIQSLHKESTHE